MKRICTLLVLLAVLIVPVRANEGAVVSVPQTEIRVDPDSGTFRFTIEVDSQAAYAGAEFGVICSQGTEISSVTGTGGSVTGPREADGLVWFGFFDGEDSFSGTTAVTVEGTCREDADGAVAIRDVSLYTIGRQEYTTTELECGTIVNLRWETAEVTEEPPEQRNIDVSMPIACFTVIAAVGAGTLVYIKIRKIRKENKHVLEQ